MNICLDITQIIIAVLGIIGTTSFITVKISKKYSVSQNNNTITNGDIVGRDKKGR